MSVHAIRVTAVVTGLALIAAGAVGARGAADRIVLRVALDAQQEAPAPAGDVSNARGEFTGALTRSASGASLTWVLPLCGPCQSPATGTATIDAALLTAIESGQAYVNVHTPTNRAGEIRAQLASRAAATVALTPRKEVPRPKAAGRARGTFAVIATKQGGSATVAWRLGFSRLTGRALAAHIHIGRAGRAGPVAVPLCGPCRNGARGTATVSGATLAALQAGRAYVNVHTRRNPGGEIRAQIPALALSITS
jgi:hypothetical protein